jgi:hypothetical protein
MDRSHYIYAGLFPLVLCLFYFAVKKVPLINKLLFGSLFRSLDCQLLSCTAEFVLARDARTEYVFIPLCVFVFILSAASCRLWMGKN